MNKIDLAMDGYCIEHFDINNDDHDKSVINTIIPLNK